MNQLGYLQVPQEIWGACLKSGIIRFWPTFKACIYNLNFSLVYNEYLFCMAQAFQKHNKPENPFQSYDLAKEN